MRQVLALATALAFAAVPTAAQAAGTTRLHHHETDQLLVTGVCSFVVQETATFDESLNLFYADDGTTLLRLNAMVVESDVFSANGKTLTTDPYHYSARVSFDAAGNATTAIDTGVVVKLRLPDGSMFVAAGLKDLLGSQTLLTPDVGTSGNIAGFCAALSG